jgi:hypothetical protein
MMALGGEHWSRGVAQRGALLQGRAAEREWPGGARSRGVRTMLSWGAPNSYGFETQHRNPVRSSDTLGNALPGVAQELQPPGFWKVEGSHPGGIVPDTGGAISFAGAEATPAEVAAEAPAPAPPPPPPPPGIDTHGVGVHVVDTPEGKVIYYPYVPASVGPLVAAAESGGSSLSSSSPTSLSNEGVVGGYLQAPEGQLGTPAVLRQTDGTWVAPGGNYQALSQAITSGQNTKEVNFLKKELRSPSGSLPVHVWS